MNTEYSHDRVDSQIAAFNCAYPYFSSNSAMKTPAFHISFSASICGMPIDMRPYDQARRDIIALEKIVPLVRAIVECYSKSMLLYEVHMRYFTDHRFFMREIGEMIFRQNVSSHTMNTLPHTTHSSAEMQQDSIMQYNIAIYLYETHRQGVLNSALWRRFMQLRPIATKHLPNILHKLQIINESRPLSRGDDAEYDWRIEPDSFANIRLIPLRFNNAEALYMHFDTFADLMCYHLTTLQQAALESIIQYIDDIVYHDEHDAEKRVRHILSAVYNNAAIISDHCDDILSPKLADDVAIQIILGYAIQNVMIQQRECECDLSINIIHYIVISAPIFLLEMKVLAEFGIGKAFELLFAHLHYGSASVMTYRNALEIIQMAISAPELLTQPIHNDCRRIVSPIYITFARMIEDFVDLPFVDQIWPQVDQICSRYINQSPKPNNTQYYTFRARIYQKYAQNKYAPICGRAPK
jgi:hypothetical protein